MSLSNMANASYERRQQRIMRLRVMFSRQQIVTVDSAMQCLGYKAQTIIRWCKEGDIPLLYEGQPIVPLTDANRPKWLN